MQTPDMITFHCPSCGMKLQVPAQMAGVTGPCPECSASISAPLPGAPAAAAAPVSTIATAPIPQQQAPQQPAQKQSVQPQNTPAQPVQAAAPDPVQQSSQRQSQPRETPEAKTDKPAPQEKPRHRMDEPKPRARWMRVIFPLAFLIVAAALVLAVLQAVGIFNVWDYEKSKEELISGKPTHPNTDNPSTTDKEKNTPADTNPGSDDDTTEPKTPTNPPNTGEESTVPAVPVIKDTHEEGEFPELQLPPSPSDTTGTDNGAGNATNTPATPTSPPTNPTAAAANPPSPPPAAPPANPGTSPTATTQDDTPPSPPKAGFLANQNLRLFLNSKTLDERMAFMSKSKHTREQLMASCLAAPLKAVKSIRMVEMVPRVEDNMTQYLYFVSFEDKEEDRQRHRIVMQVVERPGIHPPRIHGDAFIEHYEKRLAKYAKHPNNEVTTFHCIAEARTADLAKDLPKELKKTMVRLVIKSHPHGASIFDAYLNKNSPLMEKIGSRKDFPYTEPRFCVLSFRWNTTDPNHPYIELNDIVNQGWER